MPSNIRYRNVCFTSFGDEPTFRDIMSYLIYGLETCPETGRQHWQGYVEFTRQLTLKQLREILGDSHFENRLGNALEAATYCAKGGSYVEFGEISRQGRRSDLETLAQSIVNGASIQSVAIDNPRLFIQYGRGMSLLGSISQGCRQRSWRDVKCEIWWGATGTGKTRSFFLQNPIDVSYRFLYRGSTDYWCGYTGQPHVLFDEFESQIRLSDMLMYMDGHPLQLNVKFGHSYANWDTVTIISNSDPRTFYAGCAIERRNAFARRVSRVIQYIDKDTRVFDDKLVFDTVHVGTF